MDIDLIFKNNPKMSNSARTCLNMLQQLGPKQKHAHKVSTELMNTMRVYARSYLIETGEPSLTVEGITFFTESEVYGGHTNPPVEGSAQSTPLAPRKRKTTIEATNECQPLCENLYDS